MSLLHVFGGRPWGALALLTVAASASSSAQAATPVDSLPQKIAFQAYLADTSGAPLSGTYDMRFGIYTAGTRIWYADYSGVVVANGQFSVMLGDGSQGGQALIPSGPSAGAPGGTLPVAAALLSGLDSSTAVEVELEIGNGSGYDLVSPRYPVVSALFALKADTIDGYDSTQLAKIDGSGNIVAASGTAVIDANGSWVGPTGWLAALSQGSTGMSGASGASGATGESGASGATGQTGATGSDGGAGVPGLTGQSGSSGATGATGAGASGASGATGATGAGASGASGASGLTGASGATGATGAGASGATGQSGESGATGTSGATGATGAGATGQTGASGATGATGAGASGTTGETGSSGLTGQSGTSGATGATGAGATGQTGSSGATGATGAGSSGASGQSGATGSSGATGATGAGVSGATGASGSSGASGATGATGAGTTGQTGTSGFTGATGTTGASGATGATGATGQTGANGSSGSSGATGTTGRTGASGATGLSGASGSSGASGQTGASGATGSTGPSCIGGTCTGGSPFQTIFQGTAPTNTTATGGIIQIQGSGAPAGNTLLGVTANGTGNSVLTVTDQGRVGIGTGGPGAALDILTANNWDAGIKLTSSSSSGTALRLINTSAGGADWAITSTTSSGDGIGGNLGVFRNGSSHWAMLIAPSGGSGYGSVSIGRTNNLDIQTAYAVDAAGSLYIGGVGGNQGDTEIVMNDNLNNHWTILASTQTTGEPTLMFGEAAGTGAPSYVLGIQGASGYVGIGTTSPGARLEVDGTSGFTLKIVDGNQGTGKVLTSDANGVASWASPGGGTVIYSRCAWYELNTSSTGGGSCSPTACPTGWTNLVTNNIITGMTGTSSGGAFFNAGGYSEYGCYSTTTYQVLYTKCVWDTANTSSIGSCTAPSCPTGWTNVLTNSAITAVGQVGGGGGGGGGSASDIGGYDENVCIK